jgi:methyltransferase
LVAVFAALLAAFAFVPMLAEAVLSRRNEQRLRAAGAFEPPDDVYPAMQVVYPAGFVAMIAESWLQRRGLSGTALAGLVVFAAGKLVKYWAIHTLGPRWTFRVLVPPRSSRTLAGPYRFMRHPNYLGVLGELAGFALLSGAYWSGAASVAAFVVLLRARIRVEERALGLRTD